MLKPATRLERVGYATLLLILALLFIIWLVMPYFVAPNTIDQKQQEAMTATWEAYKSKHPAQQNESFGKHAATPQEETNLNAALFPFDPNTADSSTLRRLGFSAKAAHGLINWRSKGKTFYKKEDLKGLYNLPEELYVRLDGYISISATKDDKYPNTYAKQYDTEPAAVDLNTTDSSTLVKLRGIGPTLAHKLIARRNALGGYLRHDQLMEVYKFPDTTFYILKGKLIIRPELVKKMNLNTVTEARLSEHPYVGEKMAANIILYRNGIKQFNNVQQLRQVPLMDEEKYRSIVAYFIVD